MEPKKTLGRPKLPDPSLSRQRKQFGVRMSPYERAQLRAVSEATMLTESQALRLLIEGATERLEETNDEHQDESLGGRRIRVLQCKSANKRYPVQWTGSSRPKTKKKKKKKATKAKEKAS